MKFLKRCLAPLSLFLFLLCAASPSHAQTSQIPQQCKDTSGSATTQVCSTILTLGPVKGDEIIYSTTTTNTGDLTVNVDGTGAAHIKKWSGSATLAAGDIVANTPVELIFDGAGFWEVQTIGNAPGAGSVTTSGSPASGYCTYFSGSTVIIGTANCTLNSSGNMVLAGTLTAGPSVATTSDGVHAAYFYAVGNTTLPVSLPSNAFGIIGPPSASFTSYFLQPPATAPSNTDPYLSCPTPSGGVSVCSWATGGSGAGPAFATPVTITPPSSTTTSLITYPENTAGLGQQPLTGIISVTGNTITAVTSKAIQTGQSGVFGFAYASSTDTITSTGPNDSLGNAVTCGTPVAASANISLAKCWFNNSGAAGVDTITITLSGTVSNAWIAGEIYSGFITTTPTDGADVSAIGNSNAPSSGAYTSTNANDLIFTMIADVNYLNTYALGGGFNERNFNFINGSTQNGGIIFADQLATSTGSFTGSLTLPVPLGGRWIAITGGMKLSAAPAIADIGGNQTPDNYPVLNTTFYGITEARKFATPEAYALAGPGGLPGVFNATVGQPLLCGIVSATASDCIDVANGTFNFSANISNQTFGGSLKTNAFTAVSIATQANCSSAASPAVCAGAAAGSFVIAAAATSVVVDTSAVTANSQVFIQEDSSLGTKLGVTCNTAAVATTGVPEVTARTGGTSFTVTITTGPTTNPACYSYFIVN